MMIHPCRCDGAVAVQWAQPDAPPPSPLRSDALASWAPTVRLGSGDTEPAKP